MSDTNFYTLIATRSGSQDLEETLHSLASCDQPPGYIATIVVENGGPPINKDRILSFDKLLNVRYIHVPEAGLSNARNKGLQHVDGGLIFFTDDDVRFHRGVLTGYYDAGQIHGPGHYFGGPLGVDYEVPPDDWLREYLPLSAKGWQPEQEIHDSFSGFLGANWAAYLSDLSQVDRFDTNRGLGSDSGSTGEETDMQQRLADSGCKAIYVDEAEVTHLVPHEKSTPQWILKRAYQHGIKDGIRYQDEHSHTSFLPPFWLLKANVKLAIKSAGSIFNMKKRFYNRHWLNYHLGFLRGVFHGNLK
jgi:GT2 family glycosyltransferase